MREVSEGEKDDISVRVFITFNTLLNSLAPPTFFNFIYSFDLFILIYFTNSHK